MAYNFHVLLTSHIFIFDVCVQSNYIQYFLKPSTENIALCSENFGDMDYEILMPKGNQDYMISRWDCKKIPKMDNSLIILDEVQPYQVHNLLNQQGIQISLLTNIWLIHSKSQSRQIKEFFSGNELRIGLNAQIFYIESYFHHDDLYQFLGTGTKNVEQKVSDFLKRFELKYNT